MIPLVVTAHIENQGDVTVSAPQQFVGTKHQSRRLEGFCVHPPSVPGLEVEYMAHIENQGDTQWHRNGHYVGTKGQARRLEGFAVRLTGYAANNYDVKYYAHIANYGDSPVLANGQFAGTRGQCRSVEGLAIWIEPKAHASFGVNVGASTFGIAAGPYGVSLNLGGQTFSTAPTYMTPTPAPVPTYTPAPVPTYTPAPVPTYTPAPVSTYTPVPVSTYTPAPVPTYTPAPAYTPTHAPAYTPTVVYPSQPAYVAPVMPSYPTMAPTLSVSAYCHGMGPISACGQQLAGTRGQNRRLEAFTISGADVEYMAHIANKGDTHWHKAGHLVGHHGGDQIEGFAVRVVGHNAHHFDVKYFAHVEGSGDSSVCANGQFCGSKGQHRKLEGIAVWLEPKRYR